MLRPRLQECGEQPTDVGSPPSELAKHFADDALGLQLREPLEQLPEAWMEKTGVNAANRKAWVSLVHAQPSCCTRFLDPF